jgi:hypothetical protein
MLISMTSRLGTLSLFENIRKKQQLEAVYIYDTVGINSSYSSYY